MLDYNVPVGKLNRGLSVVDSCKLLKGEELTEDELFLSCALGCCIEWLQAYFLVLDDIMYESYKRRGQPCWFRLPKVGMIVVNRSCSSQPYSQNPKETFQIKALLCGSAQSVQRVVNLTLVDLPVLIKVAVNDHFTLQSLINKTIIEFETEWSRVGKPIAEKNSICPVKRDI